jgi:hypothetical protein
MNLELRDCGLGLPSTISCAVAWRRPILERIATVCAAIFNSFGLTSPAVADPAASFDTAARHTIFGEIAKAMRDD